MKIKINAFTWDVQAVSREHEKLNTRGDYPCLGITYCGDLSIYIDKTLHKELFRSTVIHELLHAYTFSFGVHLFADEHNEEPIADFVGSHLDQIYNHANQITNKLYKEG